MKVFYRYRFHPLVLAVASPSAASAAPAEKVRTGPELRALRWKQTKHVP